MGVLDTFERKGLFGFTRLLALSVVALLILGLVGGLIAWGSTLVATDKKRVEPDKVIAALKPSLPPWTATDRVAVLHPSQALRNPMFSLA